MDYETYKHSRDSHTAAILTSAQVKTASDLKYYVELAGHDSHFFTRDTMRFFGDTMKNYGVSKVFVTLHSGEKVPAYELFRRKPVKHGMKSSAYFDAETFARIFPKNEE